jgi:class 3 adenylate cyclase
MDRLPRKLAAILYADVAGYSRLTGEDEEGTHRLLSAYLDALSQTIETYGGTVVHYAGDAVLAEFPTVTDALASAAKIQRELGARNQELPDGRPVRSAEPKHVIEFPAVQGLHHYYLPKAA